MSTLVNQGATHPRSPPARGFEHIQCGWDPQHECWTAKILPGEFFVTREPEGIVTVLGSCISACIRDPAVRIGGMNHFMLPEDSTGGKSAWMDADNGLSTRYGSFAMESLINELMKLGARRERLEVKLFGGGKILASMTDVGARNIAFAKRFLALEKLPVVAEDVGDVYPRRVVYFPATGLVRLKRLRALDGQTIASRERQYHTTLAAKPATSDVELFD
jgi:chemotaxis protein CheD